jgi:chaperonin GroES
MTPIGKRLIVKRDENEGKTESGIILGAAAEKPATGTVMFNGPDAEQVFAGNKVIFMKFAGTEIKWDGEDLLIMKEEDILALI